jgi:pimeloyl-ACP methyl ester carboxylesterase
MWQGMQVAALVVASTLGGAAVVSAGGGPNRQEQATGGKPSFTVVVRGTGDRSMILIPGLLSSGDVWNAVVEHFSTRYRLHVVTIAGFAGVPSVEGPLLPRVRDDLLAYIREHALDRPVLVGHSLGAVLSLWVASTAPDAVGAIVAVDGVPFGAALMNPRAAVADMEPQADKMRAFYRSMTSEQLELQSRMALAGMITDPAHIARAAEWAKHSSGATAGQAVYELMTTDLREDVARITSDVLLVAAVKAVASTPSRLEAVLKSYEAQVASVPRRRVIAATNALHFVMLDDPQFLLTAMDQFLEARAR